MATQDAINRELFGKYNGMLEKQSEMNGYLKGVVESNEKIIKQNDKLIGLIEKRDKTMGRAMWGLLILLLFTLAIIGYGAIGKDGMFSVRQTMPTNLAAIPAHNDFDDGKWKRWEPSIS